MNKIQLICIGDLKFKELKQIEKMYLKKIGYFTTFQAVSLKDVNIKDENIKKKKEGEMMAALLLPGDFVIALDEKGKQMDSLTFAHLLEDKISYHPGRIVFLIGGHAGLAESLKPMFNLKLSFSAMTFAHDIFRVLFLEQLYRAFTIIKGITYHR